uniref:Uncharacterized protein n=1 Tax=Rhizophora mucronata TaxID=61149 RepID=A0A2P2N2V9_RHIMU
MTNSAISIYSVTKLLLQLQISTLQIHL